MGQEFCLAGALFTLRVQRVLSWPSWARPCHQLEDSHYIWFWLRWAVMGRELGLYFIKFTSVLSCMYIRQWGYTGWYPSLEINFVYCLMHGLSGFLNRLLLTLHMVVGNLCKHISSRHGLDSGLDQIQDVLNYWLDWYPDWTDSSTRQWCNSISRLPQLPHHDWPKPSHMP